LSKKPIHFTGLENPSVVIAVTEDGWNKVKNRITNTSRVFVDAKISTERNFETKEFLKVGGKKGAALCAISYWIQESEVLPVEALNKVVEGSKYAIALKNAIRSADELREVVYSYVHEIKR